MIDFGFRARSASPTSSGGRTPFVQTPTVSEPPSPRWQAAARRRRVPLHHKPMPAALPKKTARALLARRGSGDRSRSFRDPAEGHRGSEAVAVLFPGCGREAPLRPGRPRHAGDCSTRRAASACCRRATCAAAIRRLRRGAPTGRADHVKNRVLLHRVANTLNYLDIKTVVVSCGTCMDQLQSTSSTRSSRLPPARHPRVPDGEGRDARRACGRALHVPRPLPLADEGPHKATLKVRSTRSWGPAINRSRCTTAAAASLSRAASPPTRPGRRATQVRDVPQGRAELRNGSADKKQGCAADGLFGGAVKAEDTHTSCPCALHGPLALRTPDLADTTAVYIVVEMARHLLGRGGLGCRDFVAKAIPPAASSASCLMCVMRTNSHRMRSSRQITCKRAFRRSAGLAARSP
jgi:hypothetical protein